MSAEVFDKLIIHDKYPDRQFPQFGMRLVLRQRITAQKQNDVLFGAQSEEIQSLIKQFGFVIINLLNDLILDTENKYCKWIRANADGGSEEWHRDSTTNGALAIFHPYSEESRSAETAIVGRDVFLINSIDVLSEYLDQLRGEEQLQIMTLISRQRTAYENRMTYPWEDDPTNFFALRERENLFKSPPERFWEFQSRLDQKMGSAIHRQKLTKGDLLLAHDELPHCRFQKGTGAEGMKLRRAYPYEPSL